MATNSIIEKIDSTDGGKNRIASSFYCTCSTSATTAQKDATPADSCVFNDNCLITGVTVFVKFTDTNQAAAPTLKVGTATAKQIMFGNTRPGTSVYSSWQAGSVVSFTYDGTYWQMNDHLDVPNTRNTAGSTDTSSKIFIVGATSQTDWSQTYSQDTAYVGTDGHVYSNSKQVVNLSDTQALTNKTYDGYTLNEACAKKVTTSVTSGSANLITSGGVYTDMVKRFPTVELTQAEYNALVSGGTVDAGTVYYITDSSVAENASNVAFSNTGTGLVATDVQSAIVEVKDKGKNSLTRYNGTPSVTKNAYYTLVDDDLPSDGTSFLVTANAVLSGVSGGYDKVMVLFIIVQDSGGTNKFISTVRTSQNSGGGLSTTTCTNKTLGETHIKVQVYLQDISASVSYRVNVVKLY